MMIILTLMLLISTGVGAIRDKIRKIRRKQEEQIMNVRKRRWVKLGPIIIRIATTFTTLTTPTRREESKRTVSVNTDQPSTPSAHQLKTVAALPANTNGGRVASGGRPKMHRMMSKLTGTRTVKETSADQDSEGTNYRTVHSFCCCDYGTHVTIAALAAITLFVIMIIAIANAENLAHFDSLIAVVIVICVPLVIISCSGICYLQKFRDEGTTATATTTTATTISTSTIATTGPAHS